MAKSKSKPAPKSKPAAKKASKPVTRSSPKSKSKPPAKPVRKPVPKAKAKPVKSPVKPAKPTPAKKPVKPAPKAAKSVRVPAAKKAPVKPTVSAKPSKSAPASAKSSAAKSAPPKSAPVKVTPVKITPVKSAPEKAAVPVRPAAVVNAPVKPAAEAPTSARDKLRSRILAQKTKPAKPVAFSLEEVREVAKTSAKSAPVEAASNRVPAKSSAAKTQLPADYLRAVKPAQVKAASLADILGFNPKQKASHAESEESLVPDKFKRYYKLLIELRNHVTGQVDQHAEETLKRSAKEDSGDLSSYGTDGGTDSFDRDFALSLVANEQEALSEIEAALQRIKAGTYGVCEHTQQPINRERLIAVPFTRFTAAAMKEIEKTRYKVRGQTGILGEGEEGAKVEDDSGGDE